MSLRNQAIVIILMFFPTFVHIRMFLYSVKRYQLNNSAYRKRKKGETFKERFFYSRFKEEIPKVWRVVYYIILMIHPICIIACVLLYFIPLSLNIGEIIAKFIVVFDCLYLFIMAVLFWSPTQQDIAFERWIPKIRGQNRKRKK